MGVATVEATRKPETTHGVSEKPSSSRPIDTSATDTSVWSSAPSNIASSSPSTTRRASGRDNRRTGGGSGVGVAKRAIIEARGESFIAGSAPASPQVPPEERKSPVPGDL